MKKAILATKIGMTQIFAEDGSLIPVTVLKADPAVVTQVKTVENDGYSAVQVGFGEIREKLVNKPKKGHFAKAGVPVKRFLREFKLEDAENYKAGDEIKADVFASGDKVDVTATSKGKGFQGVVKRHGFGGVGQSTHGQDDRARKPGSIGACSYPAKVFKGMRMGGQMGGDRVTTQNLQVLKVIPEHNLILVKGSVAGCNGSTVIIKK